MARKRVGNKRGRIIAAAARLFAEKGYHRTTTAEVADAAGVAAGTIYIYFSSKEDLLVSVFEDFLSTHMVRLAEGVAAVRGAELKLRKLVELGLKLMEDNPDSARIFLSQLRQSPSMIKAVVKRSSRAYMGIIEGILEDGMHSGAFRRVDVPSSAAMFFGVYQSVVLNWVASDYSYSLSGMANSTSDFILQGIASGGGEVAA